MEGAEAELKRRRERGRLAQSAFRKRQAQAKKIRETENSTLKSAIAAIMTEVRPNDRPELQAKIRQASELAGLSQESDNTHQSYTSSSSYFLTSSESVTDNPSVERSSQARGRSGSETTHTSTAGPKALVRRRSTQREPRDSPDFAIYPDPFQCTSCREGAAAVLPFLGAGAFTFAGRVFWHLVDKHEAQAHAHESLGRYQCHKKGLLDSTRMISDSDYDETQLRFIDLVSGTLSFQASGHEAWLAMVEARLGYCRDRSDRPASCNMHRRLTPPTANSAVEPKTSRETTRNWLSPTSVESRIRAIVGDEVFSVMATPMLNRWEKKKGDHTLEDSTELIDGFLDKLSETFVCYGDGPQWDPDVFDSTFQEWCNYVMGGTALPPRNAP